jgi:hypothetical protein
MCSFIMLKEFKLLHGMLFSIKSFVVRLSPIDGYDWFCSSNWLCHRIILTDWGRIINIDDQLYFFSKNSFISYRTNKYKLHFYETPTGLKFVLNTDLSVGNIRDMLHDIYNKVNLFLCCIPLTLVKCTNQSLQ